MDAADDAKQNFDLLRPYYQKCFFYQKKKKRILIGEGDLTEREQYKAMISMDQDESNKRRRVGKVWGGSFRKKGVSLIFVLTNQL